MPYNSGIVALVAFILFVVLFRSWWTERVLHDREYLLFLLLLHPDTSGLDLAELARGKLVYSSILAALRRLEEEGLVFRREDYKDTKVRGYRTRFRYLLSPKGQIEAKRICTSRPYTAD